MIYDCIIIGGGPAGITASVYAVRKRVNLLVITDDIGGQTAWSGDIENYTGYRFITGPELVEKFEEHIKKYNIAVKENINVINLTKEDTGIHVETTKGSFLSLTVIIASGKRPRELGVPGEEKFKNKGVAYCATCDAPLFAGKDVAVIGGGNSGLEAAIQLSSIAKSVYLVNHSSDLSGDKYLQETIGKRTNITVFPETRIKNIVGNTFVTGLNIEGKKGNTLLPVQGVFVEVGLIPNSEFAGIIQKNDRKEIIVNCAAETNIPGIFAAGDVTSIPDKQIIIAAGDGAKAALGAYRYIIKNK